MGSDFLALAADTTEDGPGQDGASGINQGFLNRDKGNVAKMVAKAGKGPMTLV